MYDSSIFCTLGVLGTLRAAVFRGPDLVVVVVPEKFAASAIPAPTIRTQGSADASPSSAGKCLV